MKWLNRGIIAFLFLAVLSFTACQNQKTVHSAEHPAELQPIEGSELVRIVLSEDAIQRLDLQTDKVRELTAVSSNAQRLTVPYSSLIYDPQGQTWIYTSPEPRTFVRHKVKVDYIEKDFAVLTEGPPVGTVVASVGVAELYGTEFKVGH